MLLWSACKAVVKYMWNCCEDEWSNTEVQVSVCDVALNSKLGHITVDTKTLPN